MKKYLSALLAFMMALFVLLAAPSIAASASIGDGSKLSVDIKLQVGKLNGNTFTPLNAEETLKTDDVITVRICPQSDFLCGATEYVVMFDKLYFSIQGENKLAFTPNTENTFYAKTASGYSGSTVIPNARWPAAFSAAENYTVYKVVKVGNQADSNSSNGGYPNLLPGTWLFQFNLTVLKDINDNANARIFMDKRWIRSPAGTTVDGYFAKCLAGNYSSSGSSITYKFKINLVYADIRLPLSSAIPTEPAETTQSPTTAAGTTKSGTTVKNTTQINTTLPNTSVPTSAAAETTGSNPASSDSKGTVIIATAVISILVIALAAVYLTKKKK